MLFNILNTIAITASLGASIYNNGPKKNLPKTNRAVETYNYTAETQLNYANAEQIYKIEYDEQGNVLDNQTPLFPNTTFSGNRYIEYTYKLHKASIQSQYFNGRLMMIERIPKYYVPTSGQYNEWNDVLYTATANRNDISTTINQTWLNERVQGYEQLYIFEGISIGNLVNNKIALSKIWADPRSIYINPNNMIHTPNGTAIEIYNSVVSTTGDKLAEIITKTYNNKDYIGTYITNNNLYSVYTRFRYDKLGSRSTYFEGVMETESITNEYLTPQIVSTYNQTEDLIINQNTTQYYMMYINPRVINGITNHLALIDGVETIQIFGNEKIKISGTRAINPENIEVIDIGGTMFDVLGMPFTFISTAFNLTLFPNTPYELNVSLLFLSIFAVIVFVFLIKFILGKLGK